MNEILFFLFIIAVLMAAKHYVFDVPLKDKKLYQLDAFVDDLENLVESGVIFRDSSEYILMSNLIKNQYLLVDHGVPIKFIVGILSYKYSNKKRKQNNKSKQIIKDNEQLYELYKQLDEFYIRCINPVFTRKVWYLIIILIILLPILYIIEIISSKTNKFAGIDLKKLKSTRKYVLNPSLEYLGNIDPAKIYI